MNKYPNIKFYLITDVNADVRKFNQSVNQLKLREIEFEIVKVIKPDDKGNYDSIEERCNADSHRAAIKTALDTNNGKHIVVMEDNLYITPEFNKYFEKYIQLFLSKNADICYLFASSHNNHEKKDIVELSNVLSYGNYCYIVKNSSLQKIYNVFSDIKDLYSKDLRIDNIVISSVLKNTISFCTTSKTIVKRNLFFKDKETTLDRGFDTHCFVNISPDSSPQRNFLHIDAENIKPGGFCIVEVGVGGMFDCFQRLLYGMETCNTLKMYPYLLLNNTSYYYENKGNPFDYFYKQPEFVIKPDSSKMNIRNFGINLPVYSQSMKVRLLANSLINKYWTLRDDVANKLNNYVETNFRGFRVAGVHYRGTDKRKGKAVPDIVEFERKIDQLLFSNMIDKIFFCTDELELRARIVEKYGNLVLLYPLEGDYSKKASAGVHQINPTRFLHAHDTFMEANLLSRCDVLIGGNYSAMTSFITYYNVNLPVITVEC